MHDSDQPSRVPDGGLSWLPEDGTPCSNAADLSPWFGPDADGRACDDCPFRDPCLVYALTAGLAVGVAGGMTAVQRAHLIRYRANNRPNKIMRLNDAPLPGWVLDDTAPDGRHGLLTTYVDGCRCEPCAVEGKQAERARKRAAEAKQPDAKKADRLAVRSASQRERYSALRAQGLTREQARRTA